MRFTVYGVLVGLMAGIPLGVSLSSLPIGDWFPTPHVSSDVTSMQHDARVAPPADPLDAFNLEGLLEPRARIVHGGPPKDGIPALVEPLHVPAPEAEFLVGDDRVVGVTLGEEARAYPIRLLSYHEVVNDVLGGIPIAVVYCPLCDSASVVDRRIDGETLRFGVSGLLLHSNVLMYDRTHDALWTQVGGRALSGPLAGRSLTHINSWEIAPFGVWSERYPHGRVVSFDTGHGRDYRRSPYARYYENDDLYFPVPQDDRLPRRKVPVVGVRLGDRVCAVPVESIAQAGGRLEVPIGDDVVLLASEPGDYDVAVLDAPARAHVIHTFWFAWAAFHPETRLFGTQRRNRPNGGP